MVRPPSRVSRAGFMRVFRSEFGELSIMSAPEPEDLRALGRKIDAARGDRRRNGQPPTGAAGIAFRFATELGVALFVGAGLGWLLDHWLHTKFFIVVMFLLG